MSAMPAAAPRRPVRSLGDRFAEVSVPLVTVVALLLGWVLKTTAESRSVPFAADGISAQAPAGWVRTTGGETERLRVADPASAGFGTTYVIESRPVADGTNLPQFVSLLTLSRGQALTAYRVLDQQPATVNGRESYKITFVYVESNPDVTHEVLPHVVRGVEFVFLAGSRAVVVAYHADEVAYEADYGRFRQFLDSVNF